MRQIAARVKKIDVVPMVKHYMDELDLFWLLQKYVPNPKNSTMEPAQVLCMMVVNIICASKPLYKVDAWLADYMDGLSEEPINAGSYNDDQLARKTDLLFLADRNSLMTELSSNAIHVHKLETEQIHNDSTSITLQGAYAIAEHGAVKPMFGFNKDHRPDCKQVVFGLNIVGDGYVPLSFELFDGNRTDDTTHKTNWDGLRALLEKEDFIYIADCKLCSSENLAHINDNGGKFITIVPKDRVDVKKFNEHIKTQEVQWKDAYSVESSRKKGDFAVYRTYEDGLSQEGYRLIWVHSSAKEAQDRNRRNHRLSKVEAALQALVPKLNRYKLKTKDQIEVAVDQASKGVRHLLNLEIAEETQVIRAQAMPGRPGPKTVYKEEEVLRYRLDWSRNEKAIDEASKTDGIFPLTTNTDLDASEVLRKYKEQPYLEKRMYTTKSILEVAPVFLKLPRRIEAITFLYFVALMIISLMERNIRRNMKKQAVEKLPILPQGMNSKKPTWNNLNYFFRNTHLSLISEDKIIVQSIIKGLTQLHYEVLELLNVPSSVYTNLRDYWWEFNTS
ncbi:MAG: IS1634 family transposase [Syntrophobacteraceae bacterium]